MADTLSGGGSEATQHTVAQTELKAGAIGLPGVLMQGVTSIAPAIAGLFTIPFIAGAEVDVAVAVVRGRLADLHAGVPQLCDRRVEIGHEKPDRPRRVAHSARVGDGEVGAVGQREHVGPHPADLDPLEAEGLGGEARHLGAALGGGAGKDESDDAHVSEPTRREPAAGPWRMRVRRRRVGGPPFVPHTEERHG
jgi:hypothetical protein